MKYVYLCGFGVQAPLLVVDIAVPRDVAPDVHAG